MTPINHYEGDRPEDFYEDGLFIRFAMTLDEIPAIVRMMFCVDEVPNNMAVCFAIIGDYAAKFNMPLEFVKHPEAMRELCYKNLRRELVETIGNAVLNELLTNKS